MNLFNWFSICGGIVHVWTSSNKHKYNGDLDNYLFLIRGKMDTIFLEDQIMCFVFTLNYIFLGFPSSKSKIFP